MVGGVVTWPLLQTEDGRLSGLQAAPAQGVGSGPAGCRQVRPKVSANSDILDGKINTCNAVDVSVTPFSMSLLLVANK